MLSETDLAKQLFESLMGSPAPEVSEEWAEWAQFDIQVRENDGTRPLYELDRRKMRLYLHQGQLAIWESPKRFKFFIGGKQSGKTYTGPVWLFDTMQKQGPGDYLAVSATYDLFKLKVLPEIKSLFIGNLGIGRYWAGDRILEIMNPHTGQFEANRSDDPMWARIILRSADSEEGLQSATAKAAWLDEAGIYRPTVWKDVRGRVSLNRGPVLATTTIYDLGWMKQLIYDPFMAGDPEIDVIQFSSKDSPFFSDEEYESLKNSMQSWQFRMDYDAEFSRPPAAIYEDFVDELKENGGHLVKRDRISILPHHPRMVAIDPGVVNPAKLWVAHLIEDDIYVIYRAEKGGKRMTSKEHASHDVSLAKELGERVIWWAIGAKSEKYWRQDYRAAGADGVREPTVTDVEEGINRVTHLLKTHRLYVCEDLYELVKEFLQYSREVDAVSGQILLTIKDKSTYHLLDTVRYFAVQVVKQGNKIKIDIGANKYA